VGMRPRTLDHWIELVETRVPTSEDHLRQTDEIDGTRGDSYRDIRNNLTDGDLHGYMGTPPAYPAHNPFAFLIFAST